MEPRLVLQGKNNRLYFAGEGNPKKLKEIVSYFRGDRGAFMDRLLDKDNREKFDSVLKKGGKAVVFLKKGKPCLVESICTCTVAVYMPSPISTGVKTWLNAAIFTGNGSPAEKEYFAFHLMRGENSPLPITAKNFLMNEALRMDPLQIIVLAESDKLSRETLQALHNAKPPLPQEARTAIALALSSQTSIPVD